MIARVICRPELASGLELAGLAVIRAAAGPSAAEAVTRAAADPDVGILLVDDGLYEALPGTLLSHLERQALPILAPVPAPRWDGPGTAETYVMDILRQAIGYRVRPR